MKKAKKYYDGPSGVYYDRKDDEIFILEHTGERLWRRNVGDMGAQYNMIGKGFRRNKVYLEGMGHCECIEEYK